MTSPLESLLARLEDLEKRATKGPWAIYDSCSWRRIGVRDGYTEILYPCVCADGHPDLAGINRDDDLAALIGARNALPHMIALLRVAENIVASRRPFWNGDETEELLEVWDAEVGAIPKEGV